MRKVICPSKGKKSFYISSWQESHMRLWNLMLKYQIAEIFNSFLIVIAVDHDLAAVGYDYYKFLNTPRFLNLKSAEKISS